ncbi:hypothetical protein [Afipia massiliensis]|uniref:hypothetical protein n=1 Tax=Afipia massiliensis TaxID=211460 RepID=UPI000A038283
MPATMQHSFALPVAALAWLGRQGARAIAALVFIGIAVPQLGVLAVLRAGPVPDLRLSATAQTAGAAAAGHCRALAMIRAGTGRPAALQGWFRGHFRALNGQR